MKFTPKFLFVICAVLLLGTTACSGLPGSFAYNAEGQHFFYGEFDDIRIPVAMNNCSETTIITTPNNIKTGVQVFHGRVEVGSLVKAMNSYLVNDGWVLRASTRSGKSLFIYDKDTRYCAIYVVDGTIFTELQIFVAPRLEQGTNQGLPTLPVISQPDFADQPAAGFDADVMNN
ncbi:hypothetical protein LJB93_01160 [Desulfovibrio sp. OttesenSCG-928-F07]|nr:hypothetical protein [Desulfovibrio sp. OttesenSCG-928-F07]